MWSEQLQSGTSAGSWKWIKANLIPWEVEDSDLWGASIACVAASQYPELAPKRNLDFLYSALRELGPWGRWEGSSSDCCAQRDIRPVRNNIYTNAGHMWAYLAMTLYKERNPPWVNK